MTLRRVVPAVGVLSALVVGACDHPTIVRVERLEVSGTVTSTVDGSPFAGVGVMIANEFVGLSGGGIGTCFGGEIDHTDSDGRYEVHCDFGGLGGGTAECGSSTYFISVSPPDGWITAHDASDNGGYVECSEEPQVINVKLSRG